MREELNNLGGEEVGEGWETNGENTKDRGIELKTFKKVAQDRDYIGNEEKKWPDAER